MSIMIPIIGAAISPVAGFFTTYVINPIEAMFQVSRNLEDNIKELETARDNLVARRDGQQRILEEAKTQEGVEASQEATLWFSQVDHAQTDVNNLLSHVNNLRIEYEQRRGPCPNCFCWSRYRLSEKALKLKPVVDKLYEADPKSGWTAAPTTQRGRKLNTISIEGQTTTEELIHEIIDAVVDDRYVVIGLYGMGGIGKTTLLRHVNEHFRNTAHFESVIFTTVSATPNFLKIRKQIAQSLGLKIFQDDNDLEEKFSCQTRKYLLILDDIWEPIDLGEIRVPAPTKENGCKILMASRSKSVVIRFVIRFEARDSLQLISMNSLPPDEAWNLFVQKVGAAIVSNPLIEPLAKKVLKKCGGLPLAIIIIGGTMSTRETEGEWKDAVRELEQSVSNLEGMEEIFLILMFSFDKLEPMEQSLFLYCCLFPEDYPIEKAPLVDFAVGEETLCGMMHKLGDIRNKIDVLVGKLQNSSMLEGVGLGYVKMHDVMRELALWISSPTSNKYHSMFIAKASARITEAPDASEWPKATKISLMKNYEMKSLPQVPHLCPQLHTLLLRETFLIKDIPQVNFLEHMPALRILDFSKTGIKFLPPSISHLVNLRLLSFRDCENLRALPPEIGMLVQLISLDLWCCKRLRKIPIEMKKLNNLRHLNIRHTKMLKRIPHGVLSGLHKLEELETFGSGLKLYTKGVKELSRLTHLTSTDISEIRNAKVSHWLKPLAKCMRDLHLQNCTIDPSAMPDLLEEDSPEFNRTMEFMSCEGLTCVPTCGCQELIVRSCPDLKSLLTILEKEGERNVAFESLLSLILDGLEQFETICNGVPRQTGCFSNLEKMVIEACPNLKVLFTNGVTGLLRNLKWLDVSQCHQLLIVVSDEDLEIDAFPSLEYIALCELPELTAICHHQLELNWPSLSTAFFYRCPKLRRPYLKPNVQIYSGMHDAWTF